MADYWTSSKLLTKCKQLARRPAVDAEMDDDEWYDYLTQGQQEAYAMFGIHFPESLMGAPTKMTDSGDSKVFYFNSDGTLYPFGQVEIRASRTKALLIPGPEWDSQADYTWEGNQIRIPDNQTRSFPDGAPYARYISPPGTINGQTEPTLQPDLARVLIAHFAVRQWAIKSPGEREEERRSKEAEHEWSRIRDMLKTSLFGAGMATIPAEQPWYRGNPDLGG